MAKSKKDGTPVSLMMRKDVYDALEDYCAETYRTRTAAIEIAVKKMIDEHKKGRD